MRDGRCLAHRRCNGSYSPALLIPSGEHALGPFTCQRSYCGQAFLIEGARPLIVAIDLTGKQFGQLGKFLIVGICRPRLNGAHQTCARRLAETGAQIVIAITRRLVVLPAGVAHDFPRGKIPVDQPTNSVWSQHRCGGLGANVVAACLFEGDPEQRVVLKGKSGGGKNIVRAVEEFAVLAHAAYQPVSESPRIALSHFVQQAHFAIAFPVDLHFGDNLSNFGIVIISAARVDERAQALEVRNARGFAPFVRALEFPLDGLNRNVFEMTLFGEDVVGRVARVSEQVGNVAIRPSK